MIENCISGSAPQHPSRVAPVPRVGSISGLKLRGDAQPSDLMIDREFSRLASAHNNYSEQQH
jgi:hypothetical protein